MASHHQLEKLLARRYLRARSGERFISVVGWSSAVGIALGVATLIVVLSVMNGAAVEIRNKILGFAAHIDVQGPGERLYGWSDWLARIEQVDGVRHAAPYLQTQALAAVGEVARGVLLRGIDPAREQRLADKIVKGRFISVDEPFSVVVGDTLARKLGVEVGDWLRIITPQQSPSPFGNLPRGRAFRVVGIFDSGFYDYDATIALAPLVGVQRLLHAQGAITGIEVRVNDRDAAPRIARAIEERLPVGAWVTDWTRRHRAFFQALRTERVAMAVILSLIVLVAAFNMVSSLVMVVIERRREIAVLKTIGATDAVVRRIFVRMGMWLSTIGTAAGTVVGLTLAWKIESIVQAIERTFGVRFLAEDVYYIDHLPSVIDPKAVVIIVAASLLLGLVATWYPASRAARVPPAEALRYES